MSTIVRLKYWQNSYAPNLYGCNKQSCVFRVTSGNAASERVYPRFCVTVLKPQNRHKFSVTRHVILTVSHQHIETITASEPDVNDVRLGKFLRLVFRAYSGILPSKYMDSWACIFPQSIRWTVHFLIISIIARYSILKRLSSVGNTDFALVTFLSCLLNPSIAFVV